MKLLGYPRMENYTHNQRKSTDIFMETVRNGMIDMHDPEVPQAIKDNIEFTLNIEDKEKSEIFINLKKNETRSKQQKILRDQILKEDKRLNRTRVDKNVLILYIDNLSRNNFLRKLPKTSEWLTQFVDAPENPFELFQFFRYTSVDPHTRLNNNAMYFGEIGPVKNTSNNVFEQFSKNGYITGFFQDG